MPRLLQSNARVTIVLIALSAAMPWIAATQSFQGSIRGTVRDSFRELPSEGRSVFLMATLEPTVVASGNAHYNRMEDQPGNSALSMGGGALRSNNFLIDGFPTTDMQNRSSVNPSREALDRARRPHGRRQHHVGHESHDGADASGRLERVPGRE
jgi:hypothetical protein